MKDNFFFPISTFIIGIIALFFIVVSGNAAVPDCVTTGICSWLIKDDYSQSYRGLVVNTYGATNGLLVPNGNVGIGTTNPLSTLSVGGGGQSDIGIFGYGTAAGVFGRSTSNGAGVGGSGTLGPGVDGTSVDGDGIHGYSQNGNAGSFQGPVYIGGNLRISQSNKEIRFDYINNSDGYYGSLRWAGLQLGNNGDNRIIAGRTTGGGNLKFYVDNRNDAADYTVTPDGKLAMTIASNGNVGIGDTSLGGKLSIYTADNAETLQFDQNNGYKHTVSSFMSGTNSLLKFKIASGVNTQVDNVLVLKGNGNVGIGVADPQSKLTVTDNGGVGVGRTDTSIYSENNSSAGIGVYGVSGMGGAGVFGEAVIAGGTGVYGLSSGVNGIGVYGWNSTVGGLAGKFRGDVMVEGTVTSRGVWDDCDTCGNQLYAISSERYVKDLKPADVGIAKPLNTIIIDRLCRDIDGCELTIVMLNTALGQGYDGSYKFYPSEIGNQWAFSTLSPSDPSPIDNNNAVSELHYGDCYFGDFDTSTDNNNGRTDTGIGFGFLNIKGGDWSDVGTTCRLIITD